MKQIKLLIILLAFSTTLSAQWEQVDSICPGFNQTLMASENNLFYITSDFIYRSDENGTNFNKIYETFALIRLFDIAEEKYFCSTYNHFCRSEDNGITWDTIISQSFPGFENIETDNNEIYIGCDNEILISYDFGESWEVKYFLNYAILSILKLSENNFLIACSNGGNLEIYKSTNNMESWNLVCSEIKYDKNTKENLGANLYKVGNNKVAFHTIVGYNQSYVLYSVNNGNSFEENLYFEYITTYRSINNQSVVINKAQTNKSDYEYELAVSSNFENWAIYNLPFNAIDITKFNDYLYAIDFDGRIYRTNLANYVGIEEAQFNTKIDIFPNPTTSVLNIKSEDNITKISFYNSLGEVVIQKTDLKNNQIDVSDLSSGVYILNIQTEIESISEKIIIE